MTHETRSFQPAELPAMQLNFTDPQVEALRERVHGTVVVCGTDGYHQARQGFIVNYQSFPQLIVYCETSGDVREALHFAKRYGLSPVCRAGGHNTAGYAVNDGIVIDVSRINHVSVDKASRRATVGAGVTFGRLDEVLNRYALHVPGGGCPEVAIAGFMQGGGYGYTSMMFGMNCDSVLEATVVLASGEIVKASNDSNQDLFWALRGGSGNNFGVLVEVTYALQDLGELRGFGIRWKLGRDDQGLRRVANALSVLQARFTGPDVDRALGHQSTLNFIENEPYLVLRGMYNGSKDDGERLIQPLLDTDGAIQDVKWRSGTYTELNGNLNENPPVPDVVTHTRTQADSRYIDRQLSVEEWAQLARYFQGSPNRGNFVGLEGYGGAIGALAPDETAFLHRRASFDVYIWVFWLNEAEEQRSLHFLEEFRAVMQRIGNGHAYQNYPNRANPDYRRMYWGTNLAKLQAIKKTYDPDNLFSYGQTISP